LKEYGKFEAFAQTHQFAFSAYSLNEMYLLQQIMPFENLLVVGNHVNGSVSVALLKRNGEIYFIVTSR